MMWRFNENILFYIIMSTKRDIEFTIRSYINTFVLRKPEFIKNKEYNNKDKEIVNKKEFEIEYQGEKYVFERYYDDENKLILYSYDDKTTDCVSLFIDKKNKLIQLTSFGRNSGCFKSESNIGSNLLRLTLKMIEKYKDYFKVNKIVLGDNSTFKCSTNENINMGMMMTLLSGDTWYGKYGFRPFDENEYKIDKVGNKIYEKNKKIMNTVLVKDINLEKYLLKIHKKYPNEFTKEDIVNIIVLELKNPKKLLKDFLSEFTDKNYFDLSCKYFSTFYRKMFDDIGLKIAGHLYGKEI
jgi:hypothetical protein